MALISPEGRIVRVNRSLCTLLGFGPNELIGRTVQDLTHPADALEPYEALLGADAERVSHPIVDLGTTTIPHMTRILDTVDSTIRPAASRTSTAGAGSAAPERWSAAGSCVTGSTPATPSGRSPSSAERYPTRTCPRRRRRHSVRW